MKVTGEPMDEVTVLSRSAMLDVLEALSGHRESVTLVGAHAIYLRIDSSHSVLPPFTSDSDFVIDPQGLANEPLLEELLRSLGFALADKNLPGTWVRGAQDEVDFMVPEILGGGGRRAARIPPHDRRVARKTVGLEGALIDSDWLQIESLEPDNDSRTFQVKVAGPAALLVAKLFKLHERFGREGSGHPQDKDAHDIFRLLIGTEEKELRDRYMRLLSEDISHRAATEALLHLQDYFADSAAAAGSVMAGRAETGIGDPALVSGQVSILAAGFIRSLKRD